MQRPGVMSIAAASIVGAVLCVGLRFGAAAPRYSGIVSGAFDAPALSGAYLRIGSHAPVACDNAGTAGPAGAGTATITWGGPVGGVPPSGVSFVGESFADVAPGQVFRLGTLTFDNGASDPPSLIFGFAMHLSAGDGVVPFAGAVSIVSTQNGGVDRIADADVLSFDDIGAPATLAAFEGASVTAVVDGSIDADGRLHVTDIALPPGEEEHGCVDPAPFDASRGPCLAGAARAAIASACGADLPAALAARLARASGALAESTTAVGPRDAKHAARTAMRQLRIAAALAARAAKTGEVPAACADAIAAAVADTGARAAPLLRPR